MPKKRRQKYAKLHNTLKNTTGTYEALVYDLTPGTDRTKEAASAAGDGRTARATVRYRGTVRMDELTQLIKNRLNGIEEATIKSVLERAMKTIADQLRIGNSVVVDKWCSFGVTFEGRFDPGLPREVAEADMKPTCRFSPEFWTRLNKGAKLVYQSRYEPTTVKTEKVLAQPGAIFVDGNFHGDHRIRAEVRLKDGTIVPCGVKPIRPEGSKRHVATALEIRPRTPLPLGRATLILMWPDGSGVPQSEKHAVTVRL